MKRVVALDLRRSQRTGGNVGMNPITTLDDQKDLPRYFASTFTMAQSLRNGRIDFRLPDDRVFRVEGPGPGPVAEIAIHNPDCLLYTSPSPRDHG